MSSEEKIKQVITVTGKLSKLVQRENEALEVLGPVAQLKELVAEKQQLSSLYEQRLRELNDSEEGELAEADPELRIRLREAVTAFYGVLDENQARLEAKIRASQHLFEVIAEAAKQHRDEKTAGVYGQSGAMDAPTRQAYRPPLSVGLNQEL